MVNSDKVFFFLNIIIWILFYVILYLSFTYQNTETQIGSTVNASDNGVDIESNGNSNIESVAVDYDVNASEEASSVIKDILSGTYITRNGYKFHFGANGYYSGFFDSSNIYIEGGSYELKETNNKMIIRIISPDASKMVVYELLMNGPKGFLLIYEPTGFTMKMEKVNE